MAGVKVFCVLMVVTLATYSCGRSLSPAKHTHTQNIPPAQHPSFGAPAVAVGGPQGRQEAQTTLVKGHSAHPHKYHHGKLREIRKESQNSVVHAQQHSHEALSHGHKHSQAALSHVHKQSQEVLSHVHKRSHEAFSPGQTQSQNALFHVHKQSQEALSHVHRQSQEAVSHVHKAFSYGQKQSHKALPHVHRQSQEALTHVHRRAVHDSTCRGLFNRVVLSKLNHVCDDCRNLFRDYNAGEECRMDCHGTSMFSVCVKALQLPVEEYENMVKLVRGR